MSKIYYREGSETVYYQFWVRADSPEDAEMAILNLTGDMLEQSIVDGENFEIYNPDEFEEGELMDWVKNRIIDAKEFLE